MRVLRSYDPPNLNRPGNDGGALVAKPWADRNTSMSHDVEPSGGAELMEINMGVSCTLPNYTWNPPSREVLDTMRLQRQPPVYAEAETLRGGGRMWT